MNLDLVVLGGVTLLVSIVIVKWALRLSFLFLFTGLFLLNLGWSFNHITGDEITTDTA